MLKENTGKMDNVIFHGERGSSEMVFIKKFNISDVIDGGSDKPHPAFVRGGKTIEGFYLSKYQNVIENGAAMSLPMRDPAVNITLDGAREASAAFGQGFHLMTAAQWGAVALLCASRGFLPYGNNDSGKDYRENETEAELSYVNEEKGIFRVKTGSGSEKWSHNGKKDGIYDLSGNVWEWCDGLRLDYGVLELRDDENSPWYAVNASDGSPVYGYGEGDAGIIRLDFRDGWLFTGDAPQSVENKIRFSDFNSIYADESVGKDARELLICLGLLPAFQLSLTEGVSLYANNGKAERYLFRGGRWGQRENSGLFKSCLDDPSTYSGEAVGFRSVCS